MWHSDCGDCLLLLVLLYLGILLEVLQRIMMQNQDLGDLHLLTQDLETIKHKLVNLSSHLFAYFLNILQVSL